MDIQNELEIAIQTMDWPKLKSQYWEQDEFLVIENFLPSAIFDEILLELPNLRKAEHRNYVPFQKKGGSVSRFRTRGGVRTYAWCHCGRSPADAQPPATTPSS